jgi:hypothetical protein
MHYFCAPTLAIAVVFAGAAAGSAQTTATAADTAPTDIYHVHFAKAAAGQASALGKQLETQPANSPMPGHFLVLRHQDGDDWDYVVVEHLGTKATVAIPAAPPSAGPELRAWHSDTFVAGPAWGEFAKAMGIGVEGTKDSVYTVAVQRSYPGHRAALEKILSQPPNPTSKIASSQVLLQHLEGGAWQFLSIARHNSWQDFGADQAAAAAAGGNGWAEVREHSSFHHDTLADRIAPR